ncbi:ArsR/SmtB family transcription factor [Tropicimonas sp. S265A]|uniref:ArsR/SmtB family transcription factor n=1 Tax=Tropicimonas sp. S265A TaxID=3415134 RepID=UPI003C79CFA4
MDAIFKALNDPTRRALLDSLRQKDGQSLQELEDTVEMTRFGVMKHLKLLEEAGLVVPVKKGRFKYHYLNAVPLQEVIDRWIDPFLAKPAARGVLNLKSKLEGPRKMLDFASTKPDFVSQTFILCTQDALWHALVDQDEATKFHFLATAAEGSLGAEGATMSYTGPSGNLMLNMHVERITPKSEIVMTFAPFFSGSEEPTSTCRYLVSAEADQCCLTIEHYNIPPGHENVANGWSRIAAGLKSYLETGKPARFPMPMPASA